MAVNPCIEDTDCIALSIDPDSNLNADLIISPDAGNCAECTPNGLYVQCNGASAEACNGIVEMEDGIWVPEVSQGIACVGPSNPTYDTLTVGPLIAGSQTDARSGSIQYTNPSDCACAVVARGLSFGPIQIVDLSVGGRVETGVEWRIAPNAYAGGPYVVYRNNGSSLGEHAFGGFSGWETSCGGVSGTCVGSIQGGATQTLYWHQYYHVTTGTVASITFRPIFIHIWLVAIG